MKYLIQTEAWFTAPDGKSYNAAWGEVKTFTAEETLGIKTNARSTNWYVKVGTEEKHIVIAGCQIHYAVRCDKEPNLGTAEGWKVGESGELKTYTYPTIIFAPARLSDYAKEF